MKYKDGPTMRVLEVRYDKKWGEGWYWRGKRIGDTGWSQMQAIGRWSSDDPPFTVVVSAVPVGGFKKVRVTNDLLDYDGGAIYTCPTSMRKARIEPGRRELWLKVLK